MEQAVWNIMHTQFVQIIGRPPSELFLMSVGLIAKSCDDDLSVAKPRNNKSRDSIIYYSSPFTATLECLSIDPCEIILVKITPVEYSLYILRPPSFHLELTSFSTLESLTQELGNIPILP